MCVSILGVLGEQANAMELDSRLKEQWLHSYIGTRALVLVLVLAMGIVADFSVSAPRNTSPHADVCGGNARDQDGHRAVRQ